MPLHLIDARADALLAAGLAVHRIVDVLANEFPQYDRCTVTERVVAAMLARHQ